MFLVSFFEAERDTVSEDLSHTLPVARKTEKSAVFRCEGQFYGHVQVGQDIWPGEILARAELSPGQWTVIRLVPIVRKLETPW